MYGLTADTLAHLGFFDAPQKRHWFQAKADTGSAPPSARSGTFHEVEPWLDLSQRNGCGVFVQLQQGTSRKKIGISEARCLFFDFDKGYMNLPPMRPTLVIKTPRGYHVYYKLTPTQDLDAWDAIQTGMQRDLGSDAGCNLRNQVARLAGYNHLKGEPTEITIDQHRPGLIYSLEEFERYRLVAPPPPEAKDYVAYHAKWPFVLCRERLNRLLGKLRQAQLGERFNTLRSTAFSLGSYATVGLDGRIAIEAMRAIAMTWPDRNHLDDFNTITQAFNAGYRHGQKRPPIPPKQLIEDWERSERALEFLDALEQASLPPMVDARALLSQYPAWQSAYISERQATIAINELLRKRGYTERRTKQARFYVLP